MYIEHDKEPVLEGSQPWIYVVKRDLYIFKSFS